MINLFQFGKGSRVYREETNGTILHRGSKVLSNKHSKKRYGQTVTEALQARKENRMPSTVFELLGKRVEEVLKRPSETLESELPSLIHKSLST